MSNVRVNTILDAAGGNTATINGMTPTAQSLQGFRNRIINGNMVIDQRNAGASVSNIDGYGVDRWNGSWTGSSVGRFSAQRSTVAPTGFTNSWLLTVTTPNASPAATDGNLIRQAIEGFNTADLAWGSASAQPATLSFWVRCSVTGTFPLIFSNEDTSRNYGATYTVSAANTWEYKTITLPGDTTGTWRTDNTAGIRLAFGFGGGSSRTTSLGWQSGSITQTNVTGCTNLMATNGATFYITGVQLEAGSVATPFERRPYGTELQLCQRYCINYRAADANGPFLRYAYGECTQTTAFSANIYPPVPMRVTPSLTTTGTAANYCVYSRVTIFALNAIPTIGADGSNPSILSVNGSVASGLTQGSAGALMSFNNNTSYLLFTAEL